MSEQTAPTINGNGHETMVAKGQGVRRILRPRVDIVDTGEAIILLADMPGVNQEGLDITLDKNILTLAAELQPEMGDEHEPIYTEARYGAYRRTFALSQAIDRNNIGATFENGMLRVTLPRQEAEQPRKIAIVANS